MLKKIIALFALVLFVSACDSSTDNKVEEPKVYIGSGHSDWAPFMYKQADSIQGAGPEIVGKVLKELGLNINFKYVGAWDTVQAKAKDGSVDLIVAAYKTTEREAYMNYSVAYAADPVSIFVKKGKSFPFSSWSELISKKGVVTIGDSYGQEFDKYLKDSLKNVQVVNTIDEAFAMLTADQADYFVYAKYSGEIAISKKNMTEQIEIIPTIVSSQDFYITISKKSPLAAYMNQINGILARYKTAGTIDSIINKYKSM